jgi:hypothetical protein
MRLVIEIQRVGDQLVQIDFRGTFKPASVATASTIVSALAPAAFPAIAMRTTRTPAFAAPAFAAAAFLLSGFLLLLSLSHFRTSSLASRLSLSFLADVP